MQCPYCGTGLPAGALFCLKCGHPIMSPPAAKRPPRRGLPVPLMLFLGLVAVLVGVAWYMGQPGAGSESLRRLLTPSRSVAAPAPGIVQNEAGPTGAPRIGQDGRAVTVSGNGPGKSREFMLLSGRYTVTWHDQPSSAPGRSFEAILRGPRGFWPQTLSCGIGVMPTGSPCDGKSVLENSIEGAYYTLDVTQASGVWSVRLDRR